MVDLRAFRGACHAVAFRTHGRVAEFRISDGVTPNFHQGVVAYRDRAVAVVISRDTGAVAIAVPRGLEFDGGSRSAGPLTFLDEPELAAAPAESSTFTALTPAVLNAPLNPAGRAGIATEWPGTSSYDLASWKPETLGEALFNYWD